MNRLTEFLVGLLFGLGLLLSGMTDPGKVIGFLDLFGAWDPSLALVMGGAIAVGYLASPWRKSAPLLCWVGRCNCPPAATSTGAW